MYRLRPALSLVVLATYYPLHSGGRRHFWARKAIRRFLTGACRFDSSCKRGCLMTTSGVLPNVSGSQRPF